MHFSSCDSQLKDDINYFETDHQFNFKIYIYKLISLLILDK